MQRFRINNVIIQFLINFFFIEVLGQISVTLLGWIFRLFGMPQLYYFIHTTPHFHQIIFTILLLIAITISVVNILRIRNRQE